MLILQCRRISTYGSGRVVFIWRNLDLSGIAFNSTHDFNKRHEVSPRQEMRTIEVIECPPTLFFFFIRIYFIRISRLKFAKF